MNKAVLDKAFKVFGNVTNLDVVPSKVIDVFIIGYLRKFIYIYLFIFIKFCSIKNFKSCAFVEFSNQEAYQQALTKKQIEIPNLGSVTVEERKPKNDEVRSQHRYSGHG